MRESGVVVDLDYAETERFFNKRSQKYRSDNPYSVTMYQDDQPELVEKRNEYEVNKISELLQLDKNSRVLDVACGIGRWADALADQIDRYVGVGVSHGLIEIAKQRNNRPNVSFREGSATELSGLLQSEKAFNRVLIVGLLIYLNDGDVRNVLEQVALCCEQNAVVCVREPIGLEARLTLKDYYSNELQDNYNAIYRTREELLALLDGTLLRRGFAVVQEAFLFGDSSLNNRAETAQYYFILKR